MNDLITEFFQHIYEVTRQKTPEFLIHAWQDDVRAALLDPDNELSQSVLATERGHAFKRTQLRATYTNVLNTVLAFPEPLQPTALHVLSAQVPQVLEQLELSPAVQGEVMTELAGILDNFDDPTDEQLAQVGAAIQQQQQARAEAAAAEAEAEAMPEAEEPEAETDEAPEPEAETDTDVTEPEPEPEPETDTGSVAEEAASAEEAAESEPEPDVEPEANEQTGTTVADSEESTPSENTDT